METPTITSDSQFHRWRPHANLDYLEVNDSIWYHLNGDTMEKAIIVYREGDLLHIQGVATLFMLTVKIYDNELELTNDTLTELLRRAKEYEDRSTD